MPFVKIVSNVKRSGVDAEAVLKAFSKSLSLALDRPEAAVMVQLKLDADLLFAGSTEPSAFIHIRSIGKIDAERNPKTCAALTATVTETLGVAAARVFINLDNIEAGNWGHNGDVVKLQ